MGRGVASRSIGRWMDENHLRSPGIRFRGIGGTDSCGCDACSLLPRSCSVCDKPCKPGPAVNCTVNKATFEEIRVGDSIGTVEAKLGRADLWLPEGSAQYASQIVDPHGTYTWYRRNPYVRPGLPGARIHLVTKRGVVVEKSYSED